MQQKVLRTITKKPVRVRLLNIKVTKLEESYIRMKAEKFAEGNMSEWIRYAAINFKPVSSDLVKADAGEDLEVVKEAD